MSHDFLVQWPKYYASGNETRPQLGVARPSRFNQNAKVGLRPTRMSCRVTFIATPESRFPLTSSDPSGLISCCGKPFLPQRFLLNTMIPFDNFQSCNLSSLCTGREFSCISISVLVFPCILLRSLAFPCSTHVRVVLFRSRMFLCSQALQHC